MIQEMNLSTASKIGAVSREVSADRFHKKHVHNPPKKQQHVTLASSTLLVAHTPVQHGVFGVPFRFPLAISVQERELLPYFFACSFQDAHVDLLPPDRDALSREQGCNSVVQDFFRKLKNQVKLSKFLPSAICDRRDVLFICRVLRK